MNTTAEKKPYEAPQLTVVTFKAERGYASSGLSFSIGQWIWDDGSNVDGVNDYTVEDNQYW